MNCSYLYRFGGTILCDRFLKNAPVCMLCFLLALVSGCAITPVVSPDRVKFQNQAGTFIIVGHGDLILDTTSCLMWTTEDSRLTWDQARQQAANLPAGNFNDWRLPTKPELYSLFTDLKTRQGPGNSVLAAPFKWNAQVDMYGVNSYIYWSNKENPFGNAAAGIGFDPINSPLTGDATWYSKTSTLGVRYVRTPSEKELDEIAGGK